MEPNQRHNRDMTDPTTALRQRLLAASDDRRKLELYVRHLPEIIVADPAAAIALADEAYYLAVLRGGKGDRAAILRHRANINLQLGNLAKAAADLREAYELHESVHDTGSDARGTDLVSIAMALGGISVQLDDYRAALEWYRRALALSASRRDAVHAGVLLELGDLYRRVGNYNRATEILFDALAIAEEADHPDSTGAILSALGSTFELVGNDDSARDFHLRAFEKSKAAGNHRAVVQALRHLAGIHSRAGNFAKAVELALKAHEVHETIGDRAGAAEALMEIGDIHEEMGKSDLAFDFHRKAYTALPAHAGNALRLPILVRLGRMHLRNDEPEAALLVSRWALDIAVEIGARHMQYQIHQSLTTFAEMQGRREEALEHHDKARGHYEEALEHQKHMAAIRDELAGDEQRRAVAELQVRFDLEKAERELESSRQRAIELEKAMDEKKAELTALAVSLVEKEKTLERLQVKVGRLRESSEGNSAIVTEIINDINQKRSPADDWKRFELELNRIHPNFTRNLLSRAATLTPAELKICYLTKLNHSSKDIAALMGSSLRTVEKQRQMIRKKLGLAGTTNFAAFIAGL
jgi:tetratricopeptide (TPR) repeat protein/DNA-binding CsgD family transcriptional regulator